VRECPARIYVDGLSGDDQVLCDGVGVGFAE
jgi:hypothetical protein